MATRSRSPLSQFRIVVGFALISGIAALLNMACEIDQGVTRDVEADSRIRIGANAPQNRDPGAGYAFFDVGAWDDTNLEWPAVEPGVLEGQGGSGGYKYLDVGAWDDTNLQWPSTRSSTLDIPRGAGGYKFLDVKVWDDTEITWPPESGKTQ